MDKKEKEKVYLRLESIGERGIILEHRGDNTSLQVKICAMLNSLLLAEIVEPHQLKFLTEQVIQYHLQNKDANVQCVNLQNATEEEVEALAQKMFEEHETPENTTIIKRKCLVCKEKDTCKNKGIDIQCSKY